MAVRLRRTIRLPSRYKDDVASEIEEREMEACTVSNVKTWWRVVCILDERGNEGAELLVRWGQDGAEAWPSTWVQRSFVSDAALKCWAAFKTLRPLYVRPDPVRKSDDHLFFSYPLQFCQG